MKPTRRLKRLRNGILETLRKMKFVSMRSKVSSIMKNGHLKMLKNILNLLMPKKLLIIA